MARCCCRFCMEARLAEAEQAKQAAVAQGTRKPEIRSKPPASEPKPLGGERNLPARMDPQRQLLPAQRQSALSHCL